MRLGGNRAAPAPPVTARAATALELLRTRKLSEANLAAAGFASLGEALQCVAERFRLPVLELDTLELAPELAELIPRQVAERHKLVPVFASAGEVSIATSDPTQIEILDWLGRELKRSISPVIASPHEIDRAVRRLYQPRSGPATLEGGDDGSQEALAEATRIVERIILGALEAKASDIHLEAGERESAVRYRVDGALRHIETRPLELHPAMVSRLKVLAQLDVAIREIPQDGRIKIKRAAGDIDLRVSVLPTYYGEKVCCRVLDSSKVVLSLDQLGFDKAQRPVFERIIRAPSGLVLVTGPTGSGKSTTLYSALDAVRSPELNVVSVEDPVEFHLPGISQVQINPKCGLTFAGALRSILRQDPDVILVGEIRDHETGVLAAEAALTGHLVMSSLHTNDAPSSITRLTEMGLEPYLVAPSLVGIISQRLLRKVCNSCAESYEPDEGERTSLGLPRLPEGMAFRRGKGCAGCHGTGYAGRTPVREILEVTDELRALIASGAVADELHTHAEACGFRTMRHQALKRLFAGITTAREVLRLTRG